MDDFAAMLGQLGQTAGGSAGIDWGSPSDVAASLSPGQLNSDTVSADPGPMRGIPDVGALTSSPPQMNKNVDYGAMLQSIADMTAAPAGGSGGKEDPLADIPELKPTGSPTAVRLGNGAYPFGR